MIEENEVLKNVIKEVFPGMKLYENDVPKNFKRPCFVFIDPEDKTETQELTKFTAKLIKTLPLYAFYKEGDAAQGDEIKQKIQKRLIREKKHLIPGSDRRYITVDSYAADINKVDCLIEFAFRMSRTVARDVRRTDVPKIMHVKMNNKELGGV